MNERMRLNPAEASAAGLQDAQALLLALANIEQSTNPAELLGDSLTGIIGLAADSRLDECESPQGGFLRRGRACHCRNAQDATRRPG